MNNMAKRVIRLEVHADDTDIIPELLDIRRSRASVARNLMMLPRKSKTLRRASKRSIMIQPEEITLISPKSIPTRVFLYIQLRDICRLPNYDHLKVELESDAPLTKLQDHYTTNNFIDLMEEEIATFSITITQDSFANLNELCDSPLRITMYRVVKHKKGEREGSSEETTLEDTKEDTVKSEADEEGEEEEIEYEEELVPIAQGFVDLLNFFCKKRTFSEVKTFLYPLHNNEINVDTGTTVATFHLYTLLPLLKNLSLTNICYISFESIYNHPSEMDIDYEELMANISFQSKIKGFEPVKAKLCSFSMFSRNVIENQNINLKWEAIKNQIFNNSDSISVQSGFKVRLYSLFNELLCDEGVDFQFNEIDKESDVVLSCNSMHRFLLNKELTQRLEELIAFDEQEVIIDVYKNSEPDEILLQGKLDLSVFLYPRVNSCRFAVELRPTRLGAQSAKTPGSSAKSAKQRSKSMLGGSARQKVKPTFCIINICLLSPITEEVIDVRSLNENFMQSEKLKRCSRLDKELLSRPREVVCEESYREFDELIESLIKYIVENNLVALTGGPNFLCCNLGNIVNKVMKIMACDFNVRFPTKTNLEFTNLMTTVYKELELRMYNLVQKCDPKNLSECCSIDEDAENYLISFMTVIKYLYDSGDSKLGEFLYEKLKSKYSKNVSFSFYTYLWDIEIRNFDGAKEYNKRPIREKVLNVEYFCALADIYMDYMEQLEDDEKRDTAFERLLRQLELFNQNNCRIIDGWILLYCYYKNCKYQPGITYTRWKYENLCDYPRKEMPDVPRSRWEIFNSYELTFQNNKSKCFYETVKVFLCLGLYKFAEVVYAEISKDNTEIERYFMNTTFKIFLNEVEKKYAAKSFPTDKMSNGARLKAINIQINGSLDYYRESFDAAMKNYGRLLDIHSLDDVQEFQLGLLRYGYMAMENKDHESAINAFSKCCTHMEGNRLVQYFHWGRALYKLDRLPDALAQFAESTKFKMHVPDIWGYLALINLKLGNNFNALECWKYAKLEPDNVISEEVLVELGKIPHSDVFLFVDIPMSL